MKPIISDAEIGKIVDQVIVMRIVENIIDCFPDLTRVEIIEKAKDGL